MQSFASKAEKTDRDAERGLSSEKSEDKKKRNRPRKPGSNVDISEQHGVDEKTIRTSKKRAAKLGNNPDEQKATLKRIAAQPQFDKPSAVDALAATSNPRPCAREREVEEGALAPSSTNGRSMLNVRTFDGWAYTLDRIRSNAVP